MQPMELRSARLLLRDFREDDVARVFEYQTLPAYLEHYDGVRPTYEDVRNLVNLFRTWAVETPRQSYQLAVTLDSYLIGTCGVRRPPNETAEFGCELDPKYWGHGYAYEASLTLLAFASTELHVDRVLARTRPGNRAAIRLAERLGFQLMESGVLVLERRLEPRS